MKKLATQPKDWPINAPAYHSGEGWEHEKKVAYEKLKKQVQAKR